MRGYQTLRWLVTTLPRASNEAPSSGKTGISVLNLSQLLMERPCDSFAAGSRTAPYCRGSEWVEIRMLDEICGNQIPCGSHPSPVFRYASLPPATNDILSRDQVQRSIVIRPDSIRIQLNEFISPRLRFEVAVPA
jgi:hypothetical protein